MRDVSFGQNSWSSVHDFKLWRAEALRRDAPCGRKSLCSADNDFSLYFTWLFPQIAFAYINIYESRSKVNVFNARELLKVILPVLPPQSRKIREGLATGLRKVSWWPGKVGSGLNLEKHNLSN